MKISRTILLLLALPLFALGGCSSHTMAMKYQPTIDVASAAVPGEVAIGDVVDNRDTSAKWLGAIRGGYGNPLKKLYTKQKTTVEVAGVFEDGLRAHGLLGEPKSASFRLDVKLTKFDSSQMHRKEAHAHFTVTVNDTQSGNVIFNRDYRSDDSSGASGPGVFGSPVALGRFANLTLNKSVDRVLSDPDFLYSLQVQIARRSTIGTETLKLAGLERL